MFMEQIKEYITNELRYGAEDLEGEFLDFHFSRDMVISDDYMAYYMEKVDFESEEEALKSCEAIIECAAEDAIGIIRNQEDHVMEVCGEFVRKAENYVEEFADELTESVDSSIDKLELEGEHQAAAYIRGIKAKLFERDILIKTFADLKSKDRYERDCDYHQKVVIPAASFFEIDKYLGDCDLDFDGVSYSYSLEKVIWAIEGDRHRYLMDKSYELAEETKRIYLEALSSFDAVLEQKLEEI